MNIITSLDELINTNYQHISLDVWMTLIRSNSDYLYRRDTLLRDFFEINQPIEIISETINNINHKVNIENEISETHTNFEIIISKIISTLKHERNVLESTITETLYPKWEQLFLHYPPLLLHSRTSKILETLKSQGKTISLLSNTTLIKGISLKKYFEAIGLGQFLDFQIYSDECLFYKPSIKIYDLLKEKVAKIPNSQIVHIGDSLKADYQGAIKAGFEALLLQDFE